MEKITQSRISRSNNLAQLKSYFLYEVEIELKYWADLPKNELNRASKMAHYRGLKRAILSRITEIEKPIKEFKTFLNSLVGGTKGDIFTCERCENMDSECYYSIQFQNSPNPSFSIKTWEVYNLWIEWTIQNKYQREEGEYNPSRFDNSDLDYYTQKDLLMDQGMEFDYSLYIRYE